jgi:hypothetical protein
MGNKLKAKPRTSHSPNVWRVPIIKPDTMPKDLVYAYLLCHNYLFVSDWAAGLISGAETMEEWVFWFESQGWQFEPPVRMSPFNPDWWANETLGILKENIEQAKSVCKLQSLLPL